MFKKELINKESKLPKFNLQLFNDAGTHTADDADKKDEGIGDEDKKDEGLKDEEKTFTQEELNQKIKERLAREKANFEKEFQTKLALEKKEAERLAKLSEDDREKEILRIAKEEFETERLSFQREKIELQITKELAEKGLPISFAKLLVTDDADTSLENIKTFEKDWQAALEKAVLEKLKSTSPESGGAAITDTGLGKRLADARKESEVTIKENPYF